MSEASLQIALLCHSVAEPARRQYDHVKGLERDGRIDLAEHYIAANIRGIAQGIHHIGQSHKPEEILEGFERVGVGPVWDVLFNLLGEEVNAPNFDQALIKLVNPDWSWEKVADNFSNIEQQHSGNYHNYIGRHRQKELSKLISNDGFDHETLLGCVDSLVDVQAFKGFIPSIGYQNTDQFFIPALNEVLDWVETDHSKGIVFEEELRISVLNDLACSALSMVAVPYGESLRDHVEKILEDKDRHISGTEKILASLSSEQVEAASHYQGLLDFSQRAVPALEAIKARYDRLPAHPMLDGNPFKDNYSLFQVYEAFKLEGVIAELTGQKLEVDQLSVGRNSGFPTIDI